jgi:hypothetical protein
LQRKGFGHDRAVKVTPSLCVLHPSYAVENRVAKIPGECLATW